MRGRSSWLPCSPKSLVSWLVTTAAVLIPSTAAATAQPAPSANLDLSQLGRIAFAGDFDGVSLYEYVGQSQGTFNANGSTSLLSQLPNGALASVVNADAYIQTMCPLVSKDGTFRGVIVGGNFTSLRGVEAQGIALVNATSGEVTPLPGLAGKVNSVFCDDSSGTVYVGGMFRGENSTNAIAWTDEWTNLPFQGFNGPVTSIAKLPGGNIVFGGSFTGLGNASAPQTKDAQTVALASARISVSASSPAPGFDDPSNIVCKTGADGAGNTWLLPDRAPGFWQADLDFGFVPTKLRLYNTVQANRGTKTFRFTAFPINGIMNLTYVDASGERRYCEATCPLPENNGTFQDFNFVNSVGMNSFKIDISDWYGDGAGLSGIQLFQDDIYSYAVNEFNQACGSSSNTASATTTGPWTVAPSGLVNSQYLTATVNSGEVDPDSLSVEFRPSIRQSGNYSITIYTPGCLQDNTCATRGRVTVSGTVGSSGPFSTEIYQTNNFEKYDRVFSGFIDASSGGSGPTVTVRPSPGQTGPLNVVAQRVRFELISGGGGLNGIYEFDPSSTTIDTDFSKSNINRAGLSIDDRAQVNAVAVQGQTTFVAGNFSSDKIGHVFSISGSDAASLANGGLNGGVRSMIQNGSTLYLGGRFSSTKDNSVQGLNNVAAYSASDNKWQALGAGVNGPVDFVVPFSVNLTDDAPEFAVAVSGSFTEVLAFGGHSAVSVDNIAIWVPSQNNWAVNLDAPQPDLSGVLTAQVNTPAYGTLYAGSVSSQSLRVSGAVGLVDGERPSLQKLPVDIKPATSSSLQKRQSTAANITGAVTGLMYNENGLNITVIGGHFTATGSNADAPIQNLLFLNGSNDDAVTGLPSSIDSSSSVLALGTHDTTLFVGGTLSGTYDDERINGLLLFDLKSAELLNTQPPALAGPSVIVNAIAPQPSAADVYVGGSFASAGSFTCASLCIFNKDRFQWSSPANGFSGTVTALAWTSPTTLLVGGDFAIGGSASALSSFDAKTRTFTPISGVPGPVTHLCSATPDGSQFYVSGTKPDGASYLAKWDGAEWTEFGFGQGLSRESTIRGLQVFTTRGDHGATDLVEPNRALVIMGNVGVDGFGKAGAAVFNGTAWAPYLLVEGGRNGGGISAAFVERPGNFFMSSGRHLAAGFVVLIALAIALAIIFLLVVAGIIAERYRRKRDGYLPAPTGLDRSPNVTRIPPEHLFGSVAAGARGKERL